MPHSALTEVLSLAGLPADAGKSVSITGSDPVLPTRYQIGRTGAAAIAATGVAAARLSALRTGRMQEVGVSVPAAVAALRGNHYMLLNGASLGREWDPFSGFYRVRNDRSVFLHCNFPNLRDRNLGVLGAKDRAGAERAAQDWDGEALEQAIFAAGGCGSYARTAGEWAAQPHAASLATQPLFEIRRIGDAAVEPLPPSPRPLGGVRVLDLTRVIAGPTCTRTLAEHGADVLKISRPDLPHSGLLDLDTGLGKLAAFLDVRKPRDDAALRRLVRDGDVFVQSYRPGTLARRGFGPDTLAALRPGIIYVELSAWGFDGPWQDRRGYDTVVQSATGMAVTSGTPEAPRHLPVSALDYIGGNLMAFGAMAALARRATEGGSWHVRVSLARVAHWIAGLGLLDAAAIADTPPVVAPGIIDDYAATIEAPAGTLRYLGPVVRMSETPAFITLPAVPLGTHPAEWPDRA